MAAAVRVHDRVGVGRPSCPRSSSNRPGGWSCRPVTIVRCRGPPAEGWARCEPSGSTVYKAEPPSDVGASNARREPAIDRWAGGTRAGHDGGGEDQGEHEDDQACQPRRARNGRPAGDRSSRHRTAPEGCQPTRSLPASRPFDRGLRRADHRGRSVGTVAEVGAEELVEVWSRVHASRSGVSVVGRASASMEARSALMARLSRDFIVPSGIPSVAAASAKGRSR